MQQELKYIFEVYQQGSFSKAAEKLFITQPALSIAIQKVESSIGMPLFDRSSRPLRLTPAGEAYIQSIQKIYYLEDELACQLDDMRNLNDGTIRIGGSHYLLCYILPRILTQFHRKYPGIQLELFEHGSEQLAEMLKNREIDLTFSCHPILINKFKHFPFFSDEILLAVPRENPFNQTFADIALTADEVILGRHHLASCPVLPASHISDLEYILLTPGNNLYDRSMQLFQSLRITPNVKLSVAQLVTAYHLAESGFAATFI